MRPLLLIFMLLFNNCYAQIISQHIYSYSDGMFGRNIIQTDDNGFIISCDGINKVSSFSIGNTIILKTDSAGNIIWSYAYGGNEEDYIQKLKGTSDNNYVGVGGTSSFGPIGIAYNWDTIKANINVLKIDTLGNVLWARVFGDTLEELGIDFVESLNGDLIITGRAKQFSDANDNSGDILLMCLDKNGTLKWCKTIESLNGLQETGFNIINATDGGYFISGIILDTATSSTDVFLLKTDSLGDIIWAKRMAEPSSYYTIKMTPDFNGRVLLGFISYKYDFLGGDIIIADFDSSGNVIWSNKYGNTSSGGGDDIEAFSTCRDSTGYVFTGHRTVKIDIIGNILWAHNSSGNLNFPNVGMDIIFKKDHSYAMVGGGSQNNLSKMNLIQIDSLGNNCVNTTINYPFQSVVIQPINFPVISSPFTVEIDTGGIQKPAIILDTLYCQAFTLINDLIDPDSKEKIFPNPFVGQINIKLPNEFKLLRIEVFDNLNRIVYESLNGNTAIELSCLDPGIYYIKLFEIKGNYSVHKIIKIK